MAISSTCSDNDINIWSMLFSLDY